MILYPYNPEWKQWFSDLELVLRKGISIENISIYHVGSTSIPGMIAKPIIDIDIEIPDYSFFSTIDKDLGKLGYINNGDQGIKDRIAFKRSDDYVPYCYTKRQWNKHHIYVCPSFSEELQRHLIFKDYLINDASARETYAEIKRNIENESNNDRKTYAMIKETRARSFVEDIINKGRI